MNRKILIGCFAGALIYSASLGAATLIEFVDSEGETSKMWIEGAKMRMDHSDGYALTDWEKRKMYYVSTEEGMVMDMSSFLAARPSTGKARKPVNADVKKMGSGPEIAGYKTTHYKVSVESRHCMDVFLSVKAMKDMASKDVMKWMQDMANTGMEETDTQWSNPCDNADQGIDYVKLGFPMRTVHVDNGQTDEVTAIVLNASQPKGGFDLPEGMKVMDMGQMMQQMQGAEPRQ